MGNNQLFFSVVIPTYNRADFIGQTITSVLNQDFEDFEVIVVDDGSTDNTRDVISRIEDNRLKYFKKENGERGAARNFGAQKAMGKYITFLDSDDLLYDNHLTIAYNFLQQAGPIEIFFQQYEIIQENGTNRKLPYIPKSNIVNKELVEEGNFMSCHGVFIKREIFLQNQFDENRGLSGSEDYELWLRLAARYPVFYSGEITSALVQHESRSVLKMDLNHLIQRKELMLSCLLADRQFVKKSGHSIKIVKSNAYLYIALHISMLKNGQRWQSFKYLIKSVKYSFMVLGKRSFYVTLYNLLLF